MSRNEHTTDLTKRERICIYLMLWAINILAPWEHDHQQKEYITALKEMIR